MFSTLRIQINEQNLDILFFQPLRLSLPLEDKTGLALLSTWLVEQQGGPEPRRG